jgi:hypothetical protein
MAKYSGLLMHATFSSYHDKTLLRYAGEGFVLFNPASAVRSTEAFGE